MITAIYETINMFSASVPYIFQIKKFEENKSSEGFSKFVSLLSITSCTFRIFFRFGKYYHWSLLFQAIFLLMTHIRLLIVSVKYSAKKVSKSIQDNSQEIEDIISNKNENIFENFFYWEQIQLYLISISIVPLLLIGFGEILGFSSTVYNNSVGFINTIIESSLALPQVIEIYKTKNVENISFVMIMCWFLGDFIKVAYFISSGNPIQFVLIGIIQILFNSFILFYYIKFKLS